jgi:hypothetical protein
MPFKTSIESNRDEGIASLNLDRAELVRHSNQPRTACRSVLVRIGGRK